MEQVDVLQRLIHISINVLLMSFQGWETIYTITRGHITPAPQPSACSQTTDGSTNNGDTTEGETIEEETITKVGLMEITFLSFHARSECVTWRPKLAYGTTSTKKQKTARHYYKKRFGQKNLWLLKDSIRNWLRPPTTQIEVMIVCAKKDGLLNLCRPTNGFH